MKIYGGNRFHQEGESSSREKEINCRRESGMKVFFGQERGEKIIREAILGHCWRDSHGGGSF